MVHCWVYHICPTLELYNTIQYPFIILYKGNELSTNSGRILSNKHLHVLRETARSLSQRDHYLLCIQGTEMRQADGFSMLDGYPKSCKSPHSSKMAWASASSQVTKAKKDDVVHLADLA